jgi:NTP pyrophosphatase (non-canonical NTP hydrolase)
MGEFAIGSKVWPGLSKLIEEAGEVQQVCGKLLGTGGEHAHWDGSNLRERLEDEIADLIAACRFVQDANQLDSVRIFERIGTKLATFHMWHQNQVPLP